MNSSTHKGHSRQSYNLLPRPDSFIEVSDEDDTSFEPMPGHPNPTYETPSGIYKQSPNSEDSNSPPPQTFLSEDNPSTASTIPSISFTPGGSPAQGFAQSFYQFQNASASSLQAPRRGRNHVRTGSSASTHYVPTNALFPRSPPLDRGSPVRSLSPQVVQSDTTKIDGAIASAGSTPFTFGSGSLNGSAPLPKPSHRRGHHYKHSSVSMNMFQQPERKEPAEELPLYPVPTITDVLSGITTSQRLKLAWCGMQLGLATLCCCLGFQYGNICLSTLSHVVFYDAFGNLLSVVVLILTNFVVWKSSSLKYPFGLGRIEVLVGFGLSISMVFVGVDLLSHVIEEVIIDTASVAGTQDYAAGPPISLHHIHETKEGPQLNAILYECLIALVVFVSVFSSYVVCGSKDTTNSNGDDEPMNSPRDTGSIFSGRRARASAKRLSSITLEAPKKQTILNRLNSTRNGINVYTTALTVLYSVYCICYPLIHASASIELMSQISTVILSLLILAFGYRLIDRLGNTLLLKSPSESLEQRIIRNIQQLDVYRPNYRIDEFLISKVNHKIFIIVLKMQMPGASDDDEAKFRFYTSRIIRSLMYRSLNGELDFPEQKEPDRRYLVALLNLDASFDTMDGSGEQFELTIDINRM
ncbi:hypothetical protein FOA43_001403 [Brettanomyces nanus]|uniref:Cation efflux protein transmembrane domain-containing protein n=1 Tax=Eeniella nana TaxID=13502 RepID=A0A875S1W2_EENNA|nr:uncharacterized protein FOA43_001403 [Brettanomyces nanus]QPG74082.1 hypothetical protein FOA43_001403 [Brettanomyces nanus]